MFMGGGFSESPFMALSTITVNGEESLFEFIIDQSLPLVFSINQGYDLDMKIVQNFTFNFTTDPT
jgi:hypothetical protein